MSGGGEAAVGDAVDERLAVIPCGVQADGEPDVPGAAQSEAEKKADVCRGESAGPRFSCVLQMARAEKKREENRGRPEAHAGGESELAVAAKQKFLAETG